MWPLVVPYSRVHSVPVARNLQGWGFKAILHVQEGTQSASWLLVVGLTCHCPTSGAATHLGRTPFDSRWYLSHKILCQVLRMVAQAWWRDRTNSCSTCRQSQNCPAQMPMHPWQWSSKPWDRVHVDHFGPFRGHIFLILVDSYSKWVEVAPVSSTSSVVTITKLRTWFATHGLPYTLVSDNGTCFVSEEFDGFLKKNGIQYITSPAYHPASNGLAERGVRIIKEALEKQSLGDIQCKLDRILFKYSITPHTTTHQTLAELLMGRRPRSYLDHLQPRLHARVEEKQLAQKEYHDTHTKERTFSIGEPVYVYQKGPSSEWVPGTVLGIEGQVVLTDCPYGTLRCHLGHVRPRYDVHVAPPPPPPYVRARRKSSMGRNRGRWRLQGRLSPRHLRPRNYPHHWTMESKPSPLPLLGDRPEFRNQHVWIGSRLKSAAHLLFFWGGVGWGRGGGGVGWGGGWGGGGWGVGGGGGGEVMCFCYCMWVSVCLCSSF